MQVVNSSKTIPKSIKDVPGFSTVLFFYRLEDRGLSGTFGLPANMGQTDLIPSASSLKSVVNW